MTLPVVLAIDGGNWKTDLALARADGAVLALVRGPQSSPHHVGVDGSLQVVERLLAQAVAEAGLPNGDGPVAEVGQLLLAGVDFPSEEDEMRAAESTVPNAKTMDAGYPPAPEIPAAAAGAPGHGDWAFIAEVGLQAADAGEPAASTRDRRSSPPRRRRGSGSTGAPGRRRAWG